MTLDAYLRVNSLSQSEFAARARVPESQVSLWRRRERRPDTDNRLRIQKATDGAVTINAADWPKPKPERRPLRLARSVASDRE
jgi:transcriptional regulator with XRE-family HTH domain